MTVTASINQTDGIHILILNLSILTLPHLINRVLGRFFDHSRQVVSAAGEDLLEVHHVLLSLPVECQ
jgi:hypothetical protein